MLISLGCNKQSEKQFSECMANFYNQSRKKLSEYRVSIFGYSLILNKDRISDVKGRIDIRYDNESNSDKSPCDNIYYYAPLIENDTLMPKLAYSLPDIYLVFDQDSVLRDIKSGYLIPKEYVGKNKSIILATFLRDYKLQKTFSEAIEIDTIARPSSSFNYCCYEFSIEVKNKGE